MKEMGRTWSRELRGTQGAWHLQMPPECQASLQSQGQADMRKGWRRTLGDDVAFVRGASAGSSAALEPAWGPQIHGLCGFLTPFP